MSEKSKNLLDIELKKNEVLKAISDLISISYHAGEQKFLDQLMPGEYLQAVCHEKGKKGHMRILSSDPK